MADDLKQDSMTVERVPTLTSARFRNAPEWLRDMPPEELEKRERRVRRKIDFRLCAYFSTLEDGN